MLEDIKFQGVDILPDHLDLKFNNEMRVNILEAERDRLKHKMKLKIDHITPILHNVKFYYRKKTGLKFEDYGIVDVALRGEGMSLAIDWRIINIPGQPARVYLHKTRCSIDQLELNFVKGRTKHGTIDRMAAKLLNGMIKKRIAGAMAEYLQVAITRLDDTLNQYLAKRPFEAIYDKANLAVRKSYSSRSSRRGAVDEGRTAMPAKVHEHKEVETVERRRADLLDTTKIKDTYYNQPPSMQHTVSPNITQSAPSMPMSTTTMAPISQGSGVSSGMAPVMSSPIAGKVVRESTITSTAPSMVSSGSGLTEVSNTALSEGTGSIPSSQIGLATTSTQAPGFVSSVV